MCGRVGVAALVEECAVLSAVLRGLAVEEFGRPTNCPPWDLTELVVHIGMSIGVGDRDLPAAGSGSAPTAAADYYRRPERDTTGYRQGNVERTQAAAAKILAGASVSGSVAAWFDQTSAAAVAVLNRRDLDQVVTVAGVGPMGLADWVTTRVMSVAAHGLDVALTLGRPFWTTRRAQETVEPVLVSLLGMRPPVALGWDDQMLLAAGTGRRQLTDDERVILGDAHHRFPLLS
jgi:uncharacterized protein (TIGR03083 family)